MRTILLLHRCWMKCLINWRWAWPTGQKTGDAFWWSKKECFSFSARKLSFFSTLWQMLPKDAISHSGKFSICKGGWNFKEYHPIFLKMKMMLSNRMLRLKLILSFLFENGTQSEIHFKIWPPLWQWLSRMLCFYFFECGIIFSRFI